MSESIESRLTNISSKTVFRNAKKLIKSRDLLCCYEGPDSSLYARFKEGKHSVIRTKVTELEKNSYSVSCSCSADENEFCVHAFAAVLFTEKEKIHSAYVPNPDNAAQYAGLKFKELGDVVMDAIAKPGAAISIVAETEFPHAPSKWEKSLISVTIHIGGKEYKGNIANLRQLHFDKLLAGKMKLSDFPQQDRQIIRYLAINGEQDGASKLALEAEQTAEFFQCLTGFKRFIKDHQKVIIHREIAEPILVVEKKGKNCVLHPAIEVNGSLIPLREIKVVSGRAGLWVGVSGEYWWVPAFVDVAWLRSFLRTKPHECDRKSADVLLSGQVLPIKVIESELKELPAKRCKTIYEGLLNAEGALALKPSFNYDDGVFQPDGARLGRGEKLFWRRDSNQEKAVLDELKLFGFVEDQTRLGLYTLNDSEAVGLFFDTAIPSWGAQNRNFYLSTGLSQLSGGANGVASVTARCSVIEQVKDAYELSCEFVGAGDRLDWKTLAATAKYGRSYVITPNRKIVKLTDELVNFLRFMDSVVTIPKEPEFAVRLPKVSVAYWVSKAQSIPGLIPSDFYSVSDFMVASRGGMRENGMVAVEAIPEAEHAFEGTLRHYQEDGVQWLKTMGTRGYNLILADEMGLGKTIQTLALLAQTSGENAGKPKSKREPSLILCPTSLIENWRRETEQFVPGFKVGVLFGKKRDEIWATAREYDLLVCSYTVAKLDLELFKKQQFRYVILDEAQHIKNPFTGNAQMCKSVKARHKLVLTGTPLENSSEDLWSLFDFLHPKMLGTFKNFQQTYGDMSGDRELQNDLAAKVSPFILRRRKKDVCEELPEKIEQVVYCEMSVDQREIYDQYLDEGREMLKLMLSEDGSVTKMDILTMLLRLRQICCDQRLLPDAVQSDELSAKLDLLKEIVVEAVEGGKRILLFSQFTSMLSLIKEWLDQDDILYEYLDGSTSNRMERVDNFNNSPDIKLFLLSLKAGGTGLNLTSADTVIIFDPWWNPAVEAQAADRSHRIGQEKVVSLFKLVVKDSIEDKILNLQAKKQELFDNLIDNPAAAADSITMEDIEYLLQ